MSRSLTMSGPLRPRFARIAAASTSSPPASSAARPAAPPASRSSSRSGSHSACQAPSGRSSTASADRCSSAASAGMRRADELIRVLSTGLRFCGIAEETPRPAAAGSRSSAISGRQASRMSTAILPSASVSPVSASPSSVTGPRCTCHGKTGADSPSRCARASPIFSPSSPNDASVPPAPPHCSGSRSRTSASRRVAPSTPCSHPAAFTPKVVGTLCWVRVRATMRVPRCSSASAASAVGDGSRVGEDALEHAPAMSMRALSRMSWLVAPRCTHAAAVGVHPGNRGTQVGHQGNHRIAAAPGPHRDVGRVEDGVERRRPARWRRRRLRRDHGDQGEFHLEDRRQQRADPSSRRRRPVPAQTGDNNPTSPGSWADPSLIGKEDRLTLTLQPDVVPKRSRRPRGTRPGSAPARVQSLRQRRHVCARQVDARVHLVHHPAGEHDDGEERRRAVLPTRAPRS